MVAQTTKVKNGMIALPSKLRRSWKEAEVFITGEKDTILIKRLKTPSFFDMVKEFREIGRGISKKDLKDAIAWARSKERFSNK